MSEYLCRFIEQSFKASRQGKGSFTRINLQIHENQSRINLAVSLQIYWIIINTPSTIHTGGGRGRERAREGDGDSGGLERFDPAEQLLPNGQDGFQLDYGGGG